MILRLLLGLGEGVHIPMASAITSQWFLPQERSRTNAIWGSSILLSTAIAPLLIVPLIQHWGWQLTFAGLGWGGMLISLPLVYFLVPNRLQRAGGVTTAIVADENEPVVPSQVPYCRDYRFWLLVAGGSLNAFCAFGLLNWLPTYFNRAKGIDFDQLGWPLTLVFMAGILGLAVMAYLGDKFQRRTKIAGLGFLLAAGMVYLATIATNVNGLVLCFAIAVFGQSAYGAQEYALIQRLLPSDRVGAGTGLYNGLAVLLGGVGGSLIPGSIVAMTGNFDVGMVSIVVGAGLASGVMFLMVRLIRY